MDQIQIKSKDLVYGGFIFHPTGLEIAGSPSFEEWMKCGEFLRKANKSIHFWIGDWLNFGEQKYGEMYTQAISDTAYGYFTLAQDKWVASKIEFCRRLQNLTWSHHQEVADLMPEDQDLLLKKAEDEKLDSKQFRVLTRQYKLKLEVPEMKKPVLTPKDFELVQGVIDPSLLALDKLQALSLDTIHIDARDYLLSHLKQAIGIMAKVVEKYGK